MIQPHGSETLHPLFVYDVQRHHELQREAQEAMLENVWPSLLPLL